MKKKTTKDNYIIRTKKRILRDTADCQKKYITNFNSEGSCNYALIIILQEKFRNLNFTVNYDTLLTDLTGTYYEYYIFEDVIKTDGMGYPNITPYINQYKQINGVFDIIRERLKNPTIFKFLRKYFIEHSSVKKYPYKNPYFSNIIFILNSKYNDGFNDDENAISFILSIIDFITISLFNPDHCNIHKRYYEHPIGTAMFYNILISIASPIIFFIFSPFLISNVKFFNALMPE